ncbi:MAG: CocE/NonD family hydrolase [Syntrophales bacterium LBB04]|nr:CocE/NonD family hydrolase [Syntrophales bacterium LBB04]
MSANKKQRRGSQPMYQVKLEKDVYVPARDGVKLAVDVFRPDADGKFPALLAYGQYGKELEELGLTFPPQARPGPLWDGAIEAGDTNYIVGHGYVHVVADARGTGKSEGECYGFLGTGGDWEGKDCYDLIEWIAAQPWCNGNIGMVGISYLGSVQVLAAGEKPPHLKAIFLNGGHFDMYEWAYHGGIMWLMPRAALEGRGGDSGVAWKNVGSAALKKLGKEEFERRIRERLQDPDVKNYPNFIHLLEYPQPHPQFIDWLVNPCDGPFYKQDNPISKADRITIPVHISVKWGRGWTVDGTIDCYHALKGPKWLELHPLPPMQERPFHEYHDAMLRWYDYWLKGMDTGVTKQPPIKVFVEGVRKWRYENEWPLARTAWTEFYLRPRHRLVTEPEPLGVESVPPDGFYQPPLTVTNIVQVLRYATAPMSEDTEVTGPGAFYMFAAIDTDDTNFIAKLNDIDPYGNKSPVSTGWLKASHREVDESKSTPWRPHHPHTRAIPVAPGEIYKYAIQIYSMSWVFKTGHRIELEIRSQEASDDPQAALLPPDASHLPSGRATTHKIYRDREHTSHLLLPLIPAK